MQARPLDCWERLVQRSASWIHPIHYNIIALFHENERRAAIQGGPKTDTQFYFGDNFGNSAPILTILSLLQA